MYELPDRHQASFHHDAAKPESMMGYTQVAVNAEAKLLDLTRQNLARNIVADTSMQAASDRSHCLITLTVCRHLPDGPVMRGKLTFVKLAGEIQSTTTTTHEHLYTIVREESVKKQCVCQTCTRLGGHELYWPR